ncbi:hypothetical protein Taro_025614, partial [Colocasia esculenta]|nr:hypothetical protein [Colocasia esculenta]
MGYLYEAMNRAKKLIQMNNKTMEDILHHDLHTVDLETIEEDNDDETLEPSDNLVYQTSNDSTSKTSTPSEGSDHRGD